MQFFKNLRLGMKIGGGYALVLGLMALISVVVFNSINHLVDSAKWVNHTHEVIENGQAVGAAMVDMETGQRGFMISGEDEYLAPYDQGIKTFDELIAKGEQLTSDNPTQVARWRAVKDLKERWVSETAAPQIAARREVTKGAKALETFKTISARTVGKDIFDSIRASLANLESKLADDPMDRHLVTAITLDLVNMETGQRGFLLTGKDASLEPYNSGQSALKTHLNELRGRIASGAISSADVQQVEDRVNAWLSQAAEPEIAARREMNKYPTTIQDVARMMAEGPGKQLMDTIRGKLKEIIDAEAVLIGVRGKEQEATADFAINFTLIGTLVAMMLGAGIAWLVIRGVIGPLGQTNMMLRDIAEGEGDLTKRIPVNSKDEVGDLAVNFNTFVTKLQGIIGQVAAATTQLAQAAEEMATVTQQTAGNINQQKSETEQVAAAINEMSATVQEVARSAASASNAANQADDEAKAGNKVVSDTIQAITNLSTEVEQASGAIETLKDDSQNIGTVLDVIKGIAEQTNLLALNAAIEAARAGEQGRGFAVVADEVRTLAQRTQESTTEIESLIDSLQTGADHSVKVMEQSRDRARHTVDQAQHAGDSLASITNAVSTIREMNTHIATAAEEQSCVADEINRNVLNIQEISEQTATGSAQTSSASSELARLGEQLQSLVGQFRV